MSQLLKQLEKIPEIMLTVEMTSLEDAYLRIVKLDKDE
jgi:hypothetical protein